MTPRTSAAGDTLPGSKLRRVIEHIQAPLDQDLTLAHLGAVVSMSPYHFARRFQHSTGLPPHRFVVRERIGRAVRYRPHLAGGGPLYAEPLLHGVPPNHRRLAERVSPRRCAQAVGGIGRSRWNRMMSR